MRLKVLKKLPVKKYNFVGFKELFVVVTLVEQLLLRDVQ